MELWGLVVMIVGVMMGSWVSYMFGIGARGDDELTRMERKLEDETSRLGQAVYTFMANPPVHRTCSYCGSATQTPANCGQCGAPR
jgi:hypothetical protein